MIRSRRRQMLPTREPGDRARHRILDAAFDLFALQGFAGTSIEQVIAACAIGRDTFYRRFSHKLELFEAVAVRERDRINDRFATFAAASRGTPLERLEAAARWLLDVNLDPMLIGMKRIALSEARVFGRATQEAPTLITDHLIAIIRTLQDDGIFLAGDEADIAGYIINSLVLGPIMQAMMADQPRDDRMSREAHFNRTWPRIVRGLSIVR